MTGIYLIRNLINNKAYIGKAVDIKSRFGYHIRGTKTGTLLGKAIKKYGAENFALEIIEECSKEELSEREKYWISYYDAVNSNMFYNVACGGQGGDTISGLDEESYKSYISKLRKPRPDKFKKEQSERFKGSKNPMYGKKASSYTRRLLTEQRTGRRWMNNGTEQKFLRPSDVQEYELLGWNHGMLHKDKSATTIESITSSEMTSE